MSLPPWEVDRPLTLEVARATVHANFPGIDSGSLELLGSGWEFDAFRTADGWVFRFPRRAEGAGLFEPEARVHELVAKVLAPRVTIPKVELMGKPGPGFPYESAGHRFIPGHGAHEVDTRLLPVLAREIGTMLGAVHSIPEEAARAAGIVEFVLDGGRQHWVDRCLATLQQLRETDPTIEAAATWVTQQVPLIRPFVGPLRLIHHDLSPDHLIVDPETGRLRGVLDWTDAILGDAARDFVFLVTWRGWSFTEQVLAAYPLNVDGAFRDRLRRSARILSVLWLAEAYERGWDPSAPARGVRNAFRIDAAP